MGFSDEIDQLVSNLGQELDDTVKGNNGKQAPPEKDSYFIPKLFLLLLFLSTLVNVPILILGMVFFGGFSVLKRKPLPYWVAFLSFAGVIATLLSWSYQDLLQFLAIWRKLVPKVVTLLERIMQNGRPFQPNGHTLIMTVFVSLTFGSVGYIFFSKLKKNWFTYEKEEAHETYLESDRYKKIERKLPKLLQQTQKNYREGIDSALYAHKVLLGIDIYAKPAVFPIANLFTHTLVQGTTGTGKTYMMYNLMEEALREQFGVLFVDGKGDPKTVREITQIANKYQRKVYVFSDKASDSPDGQLWHYNPVMYGKPTAITERLMAVMDWSESFYENESKNLLQQIILFLADYIRIEKEREHRDIQGEPLTMDLETIHRFLDLSELAEYLFYEQSEHVIHKNYAEHVQQTQADDVTAKQAPTPENVNKPKQPLLFQKYIRMFFRKDSLDIEDLEAIKEERSEQSKLIRGLRTQLEQLIYSDLGERFTVKEGCTLDLERILKDGDIAIFSLDSNNYNTFIPTIGRFIVADSAYITTTLYGNTDTFSGVLGVFDEFGSYGNDNILDILSKARSAKMGAVLGIQSISDLANKRRNIDIKEQTIDNCNLFILGRTNSADNAEEIAELIGTYKDIDRTVMTENQLGSLSRLETKGERGTVRKVNKFTFNPDNIKYLPNYQFFYVNKNLTEDNKKKVFARNAFVDI